MKKTVFLFFVLTLVTMAMGGCGAGGPDPALQQQTAIAGAVTAQVAAMTTQAFLNPSATPTPIPTATVTPTPMPTNTPLPTMTFTPQPTVATLSAKLTSIGTFPVNRTEFTPNENFSIAVTFLNTGTVPWYPGAKLVLVGHEGEHITVQQEAVLSHQVNPGEKIEFDLWAYGSEDMSYQRMYFQLYSDYGSAVKGGYAVFGYQPK